MEPNHLAELIEQSIELELNMAALYGLFAEAVDEDRVFWWRLQREEKSHATLIRAARDSFVKRGKFPYDLIANSIDDLKKSNARIAELIVVFRNQAPSRCEACRTAVELEQAAGEMHYTRFMEKEAQTTVESVFQQLNRGDKEHERRIRAHCEMVENLTDAEKSTLENVEL